MFINDIHKLTTIINITNTTLKTSSTKKNYYFFYTFSNTIFNVLNFLMQFFCNSRRGDGNWGPCAPRHIQSHSRRARETAECLEGRASSDRGRNCDFAHGLGVENAT